MWCCGCKKFVNNKKCLKHELVNNIDELLRRKYIDVEETKVRTYDYLTYPTCNCPIHNKQAKGYCFTCKRCICLTDGYHFDHESLLFQDFEITNDIEVNYRAFESYTYMLNEMINSLNNKDAIFECNLKMKSAIIKELATAVVRGSDSIQPFIIETLNVINKFDGNDLHHDFERLEENIEEIKNEIINLSFSDDLQKLIKDVNDEKRLPQKYRQPLTMRYNCLNDYTLVTVSPDYVIMKNIKTERYERFVFHEHIILSVGTSECIIIDAMEKIITINPNDRIYVNVTPTTNKIKDYQFNNSVADKLYFINTENKLVEIDLVSLKEEILYPEYDFKSILTLYRTNLKAVCISVDDEIYYIDETIHKYPWKIDYDELKYYIGSAYNSNPLKGILASNRMLYRFQDKSIRIKANFIYYDDEIILCGKKSFRLLNIVF